MSKTGMDIGKRKPPYSLLDGTQSDLTTMEINLEFHQDQEIELKPYTQRTPYSAI